MRVNVGKWVNWYSGFICKKLGVMLSYVIRMGVSLLWISEFLVTCLVTQAMLVVVELDNFIDWRLNIFLRRLE